MTLTKPQIKLFYRILHAGSLRQNGRALKMINALEKAGLISATVEVRPSSCSGRHTLIYTLIPLKCSHGKWKTPGGLGCDACFDEKPRCLTCGRLT